MRILRAGLKDRRQFTEEQELYLKKVVEQLEEGALPKQTSKETLKALELELKNGVNQFKILAVLQNNIPKSLLEGHFAENYSSAFGKREVILSEYLGEK